MLGVRLLLLQLAALSKLGHAKDCSQPGANCCDKLQRHEWTPEEEQWCCVNGHPEECKPTPPPVQELINMHSTVKPAWGGHVIYDCSRISEFKSWSPAEAEWCYAHWGIGSPSTSTATTTTTTTSTITTTATTTTTTTTTIGEHDCVSRVEDWVNFFSYQKKQYCCKHWETTNAWPHAAREQCCDYLGFGCPHTTLPLYDCNSGYFNWVNGWSPNKKVWCCQTAGRGCVFDCSAHFDTWTHDWSDMKKTWCCLTERRGCTGEGAQDPPPASYLAALEKGEAPRDGDSQGSLEYYEHSEGPPEQYT